MLIMILIDSVLLLILVLIIVLKTIHFFKHIRRKRLADWFYFTSYNIILSSSPESAEAKRRQNIYTICIAAMLLLIGFAVYVEVLLLNQKVVM